MSTTTTNYSLIKPELTDAADITAMNPNWDTIDSKLYDIAYKNSDMVGILNAHLTDLSNPHGVDKRAVGLGNVDNTSDANKPISTAVQTALNNLQSQINAKPNAADLNGKVDKTGDTLTGVLSFQNKTAYAAIGKFRTINGIDYYVDFGCGNIGGKGCIAMKYMEGNTVKGRLEISGSGVSFYDENNKRTYLYLNTVVDASVE